MQVNLTLELSRVNTMNADDLAPCGARSSATTVLKMYDERVFHEEGSQLPVPSHCQEMK